jgi:hypothetical protein
MAWTATHVFTTGEVVTAATMNAISGDLDALNQRNNHTATVATSQTTTSTTYADLATVGPTVSSLTTGTFALVVLTAFMSNSGAGNTSLMTFDVSGATTLTHAGGSVDTLSLSTVSDIANAGRRFSAVYPVTLTAGSNTFTAKYRVSAGTGTFIDRNIIVIPQF